MASVILHFFLHGLLRITSLQLSFIKKKSFTKIDMAFFKINPSPLTMFNSSFIHINLCSFCLQHLKTCDCIHNIAMVVQLSHYHSTKNAVFLFIFLHPSILLSTICTNILAITFLLLLRRCL